MTKAMSKTEVSRRIRLAGTSGDYTVHHDFPGTEGFRFRVPDATIGHALVKTLRELAIERHKARPIRRRDRRPEELGIFLAQTTSDY